MKVERVTAYRTTDGRLYSDRMTAVMTETRRDLEQFFIENGCNEAQAKKLADRGPEIAEMTEELQSAIRKERKARGG